MIASDPENVDDLASAKETQRDEQTSDSDLTDSDEEAQKQQSSDGRGNKPSAQEVNDKLTELLSDIKAGSSKQIMSGGLDLTKEEDIKTFIQRNQAYLGEVTKRNQNFLHMMADDSDRIPHLASKLRPLVTALIALPANLLSQIDLENRTPLEYALLRKSQRLARYMCEQCQDLDQIVAAPSSSLKHGAPNCVHLAIMGKGNRHNDRLVECIIDKCSKEMLLAVDDQRRTPLHLAVEAKRCDAEQVGIVRRLVAKCDGALASKSDGLTPYRYHLKTSKEFTDQQRKNAAVQTREEGPSKGFEKLARVNTASDPSANKANSQPDPMSIRTRDYDAASPTVLTHGAGLRPSRPIPKGAADSATTQSQQLTVKDSKERMEDRNADKNETKNCPKTNKVAVATEAGIKAVNQYLKEYCLRTKNPDKAVELLYDDHQQREIYFDLIGDSHVLSKEGLEKGLGHLDLEEVLQYIAIPQLQVDEDAPLPPPPKRGQQEKPPKPDGNGRHDLEVLFNWLKTNKWVNTVFRVIVDDLKQPSHQDESIETCLRGINGVEIWDWRKFDLCPDVIQSVAPDVRVLHLYWSGNNAVLRGWSEPEGLMRLRKLETVHLHSKQNLESRTRMKRCETAFTERLGRWITVHRTDIRDDMSTNENRSADAPPDPVERHRWVTTMENFADFIQNAESLSQPRVKLERPVTVALIDDGINSFDRTLHLKISSGKSFSYRDQDQQLKKPYYMSGGGHGTAMAHYICKVCPNVALYILRLEECLSPDLKRRNITAESAAKAVRAATKKKVDIICMSWTIAQTNSNKEHVEELDRAISEASTENILMFCAATDEGLFKQGGSYPAASKAETIFKIGAAKASGQAIKWVGTKQSVDFILPGHQVVLQRDDDPSIKERTALTGSSVATALASGLAAVILYCVQLAAVAEGRGQGKADLRKYMGLKTYSGMKKAFEEIGTTSESGYKYLTVWEKFHEPVEQASHRPGSEWIRLVQELATAFT